MSKFKTLLSILLILSLTITLSSTAFATDIDYEEKLPDKTEQYYVDLVDDEGNIITVLIEEKTFLNSLPSTRAIPVGGNGSGDHYVGEIKTVTIRIKNAQIGIVGAVGKQLKQASLKKLANLAGKAAEKALGPSISGGIGTIAIVAGTIGDLNTLIGNTGFKVTMTFKWSRFQHKIQGIDMHDWGLTKVKVTPY